jgi:hypothetical protein
MAFRSRQRFVIAVVVLLATLVAISVPLYYVFGEQLVRNIYAGKSLGLLNSLITQQDSFPVEHYLQVVNETFWMRIVGFPLTFVFAVFVYLVLKYLFLKIEDEDHSEPASNIVRGDVLLALGVYSLLTVMFFYPCLSSISTHLIGPAEDNLGIYWEVWWANDKVLHGIQSLTFTDFVFYPQGSSLYYAAWSFYNLLLSFPLGIIFGNVAAYNLIILHSFPFAGLGAFLLIRYLTRNSWLALLGGFMFAFSPLHFAKAQHHWHINTMQFVPLFVLFYIRAVKEGTRRNLILATLFFLLNALADWNYLFFAGYFILFSYIYLAIRRGKVFLPDIIKKSVIVVGVPLIFLSPWLIPMVWIGLTHQEVNLSGHNSFVADLVGLYIPNHFHWLNSISLVDRINKAYTGNFWESVCYLGFASIAFVVATFDRIVKQTARYFIGAVAFLIMALGVYPHFAGQPIPVRLPNQVLSQLPFLANLRCPVRFMTYVYLFWSIIVIYAVRHLIASAPSGRRKLALTIILPTLLLVDYFAVCYNKTEVAAPPCYQVIVADTSSFGILNLPEGYGESCRYMMHQTLHDKPIVNGATTRKVGKSLIDSLAMNDLDVQRRQLVDDKVKYLVVHKDLLVGKFFDLTAYRHHYGRFYEDDRSVVFRVY